MSASKPKGILKTSRSIDGQAATSEPQSEPSTSKRQKAQRFDEMNIIETYHPANKDYGHMKVDEPKTPYSELAEDAFNSTDEMDANLLAAKLAASMNKPPKVLDPNKPPDDDDSETEEDRLHRIEFERKRKQHYNEFHALQLAKKLMEEEEDDDDAPSGSQNK